MTKKTQLIEKLSDYSIEWINTGKKSGKHPQKKFSNVKRFIILNGQVSKNGKALKSIGKQSFRYSGSDNLWIPWYDEYDSRLSQDYKRFCDKVADWLNDADNAEKVYNKLMAEKGIDTDIGELEAQRKEYGNPVANKWFEMEPYMNKEWDKVFGTRTEDILKYGTREEIEFLRESKKELLESRMLGSLIEKFPEFKDKVMKLFKLDEVGIGKLTYLDDRALLRQYKQFLIGLKIEPTITALIDYIKNQKTGLAKF